jgi:uncharacterized cupin superfamily protein
MNEFTITGNWISSYTHDGDQTTTHTVVFSQYVDGIIGESLPQEDQTHLTLKLQFDSENNVFTGTWQEVSSVNGKHQGKIFHGALQLIPNLKGDKAEGKWVGYNSDHTNVNTGTWTLAQAESL